MDWNKVVAANVKRLRLERGLTQERLAHESELDLTYVGGIERERRNPTVDVLGRIASVLGVTPSQLLEDDQCSTAQKSD
ncbi:MAG: helix-turn-helix transcriptional regulator [Pseudomonadota bacterium]